jgi:hypothetical protein
MTITRRPPRPAADTTATAKPALKATSKPAAKKPAAAAAKPATTKTPAKTAVKKPVAKPAAKPAAKVAAPPKKKPAAVVKTAESFIESANHPVTPVITAEVDLPKLGKKKGKDKEKHKDKSKDKIKVKTSKDKEAVLIRFEDEQLTMMDARATELGLSRAAWLRMVVAKALMGKKR